MRDGRDSDLDSAAGHIRSSHLVVVMRYRMVAGIDNQAVGEGEIARLVDSS